MIDENVSSKSKFLKIFFFVIYKLQFNCFKLYTYCTHIFVIINICKLRQSICLTALFQPLHVNKILQRFPIFMQIYHTNAVVIKTKEFKSMFTLCEFKKICMCLVAIAYWKHIVSV